MPNPPKGLGLLGAKPPPQRIPSQFLMGGTHPLVICKYLYWAQHPLKTGSELRLPLSDGVGGVGEAEGFA